MALKLTHTRPAAALHTQFTSDLSMKVAPSSSKNGISGEIEAAEKGCQDKGVRKSIVVIFRESLAALDIHRIVHEEDLLPQCIGKPALP
jgi:hypothetical protein